MSPSTSRPHGHSSIMWPIFDMHSIYLDDGEVGSYANWIWDAKAFGWDEGFALDEVEPVATKNRGYTTSIIDGASKTATIGEDDATFGGDVRTPGSLLASGGDGGGWITETWPSSVWTRRRGLSVMEEDRPLDKVIPRGIPCHVCDPYGASASRKTCHITESLEREEFDLAEWIEEVYLRTDI